MDLWISIKLGKKYLTNIFWCCCPKWWGIIFAMETFSLSFSSLWYLSIRIAGLNWSDSIWIKVIFSWILFLGTLLMGVYMKNMRYCFYKILSLGYWFNFFIFQMSIGSTKVSKKYSSSLEIIYKSKNYNSPNFVDMSVLFEDMFIGVFLKLSDFVKSGTTIFTIPPISSGTSTGFLLIFGFFVFFYYYNHFVNFFWASSLNKYCFISRYCRFYFNIEQS